MYLRSSVTQAFPAQCRVTNVQGEDVRIVNAMFGRKKGGIEQAFVDYSATLITQGNEVLTIAHPQAAILPGLTQRHITPVTIANYGQWDFLAVFRLRKILQAWKPDIIITHGNRSTVLLQKAAQGKIPIAGVCHNYSLKHLLGCNALFTITHHLKETVIAKGFAAENVFILPNMIALPTHTPSRPNWRNPPVIGTMGRFVAKKGFDVFIEALQLLRQENIPFTAHLGGNGEEETRLRQQAEAAGLAEQLRFTGWVEDKAAFFEACDIFCLPSLHEPFGIVLLEALLAQLPIVSTSSEGPREIITHEKDALLVPVNDAKALATALKQLLQHPLAAKEMAETGYHMAASRYDMNVVGKTLHTALGQIIASGKNR